MLRIRFYLTRPQVSFGVSPQQGCATCDHSWQLALSAPSEHLSPIRHSRVAWRASQQRGRCGVAVTPVHR